MTKKNAITAGQLFCMLFISRMVVNITYSPFMATTGEMMDHILSSAVSIVATLLMLLPVYFLSKRRPRRSLIDDAFDLTGKFLGFAITALYGLYFLFVCSYSLSLYSVFVTNVMTPKFSLEVLAIAVMLTACYGAYKGVEALARASGIILIVIVACLVFIVCALAPRVEPLNYTPLLYEGTDKMWNGVKQMIGRTACIPVIAMLLPHTKGNVKKSLVGWVVAIYVTMMILIAVIVGALGDFLKTQIFPIYAAASVAELGIFKRIDALFFAVWTSSLFLKVSLFLLMFSFCVKKLAGEKASRVSVFLGAAAVLFYSLWTMEHERVTFFIYQMDLVFWITLATSLALPALLLAVELIKNRKKGKSHAS